MKKKNNYFKGRQNTFKTNTNVKNVQIFLLGK